MTAPEIDLVHLRPRYQADVADIVTASGVGGLTFHEVIGVLGGHHGTATGALSLLHKRGVLARLTDRRGRCKVYVHPDYIEGRDVDPPLSRHCHECGAEQ